MLTIFTFECKENLIILKIRMCVKPTFWQNTGKTPGFRLLILTRCSYFIKVKNLKKNWFFISLKKTVFAC